MFDYLDSVCLRAKIRLMGFVENFKRDEAGVSALVATVLLLVIVVALAAVFWDAINEWFTHTIESIFGDAEKIGKS